MICFFLFVFFGEGEGEGFLTTSKKRFSLLGPNCEKHVCLLLNMVLSQLRLSCEFQKSKKDAASLAA